MRHWVPTPVLKRIAEDLGGSVERARLLVAWCAAVHDVGKASPAFAVQVPVLAGRMREVGLGSPAWIDRTPMQRQVNHALVGHVAVQEWLAGLGFHFRTVAEQWASVVGSHHGVTPGFGQARVVQEQVEYRGTGEWEQARKAILDRAAERVGGRERVAELSGFRLTTPALALATAVVILADWIASNSDFFPLRAISTLREPDAVDDGRTAARLRDGWERLGLPGRWIAPVPGDPEDTFTRRFGRTGMRDVQRATVEAAVELGGPGLLVVEAPMGSGKTEAALLAAEVLAHSSGANGCFIALPTQATTDAMFSRVHSWLRNLPGGATVSLAHGKAHLNDEYTGLARGRFNYVGADDAVTVHDWLQGRKKSGLADFVVGTIDQVLFAGLKSRHLMLRHLMLAGKVVVIDEVHAYDVYMSQYLDRVLHWLGAYRVPVVLLSATLPDVRRRRLIAAYESGRGVRPERDAEHPGYPVISGSHGIKPRVLPLPKTSTKVTIDRIPDDLDRLVGYLTEHLTDGGCAVVVRNTVKRVQETADKLIEKFGAEQVSVNHARFLACDRAGNDRELLRLFGPPGQSTDRPTKHIVVASQVVEQSLDIDFDVMVTDLAPIDLILQRLGRLHRHDRPDRTKPAHCAVTGVDWTSTPPQADAGSRKVYLDHQLLRAAALLVEQDKGEQDKIALPHDIARLVQRAYGPDELGPLPWREAMVAAEREAEQKARDRTQAAKTYLVPEVSNKSLVGWLEFDAGEAEDDTAKGATIGSARVRDGSPSLEVLVVQRDAQGNLRTPDWIAEGGGELIPTTGELPWHLTRTILACSLRFPRALSHNGIIDAVIADLKQQLPLQDNPTWPLRGQLVLVLDNERFAQVCGFRLTYDKDRGLRHEQV